MFPDRLLAGYRAFLGERLPRERSRFETLAERASRPRSWSSAAATAASRRR